MGKTKKPLIISGLQVNAIDLSSNQIIEFLEFFTLVV